MEKLKTSLLNCLLQLSSMSIRNINEGSITGSCLGGDADGDRCEQESTLANPLRPVAPLCVWLLLPLAAASTLSQRAPDINSSSAPSADMSTSASSQMLFDTMVSLSRLDSPFALSLFDTLALMSNPLSPRGGGASEARRPPVLAWEGLRAHPVVADSYTVLNKIALQGSNASSSSLSSGLVLPRLLGSGLLQGSDVFERLVGEL
jgi:hypothetical protein